MANKVGRPRKGPGRPKLRVEKTTAYLALLDDFITEQKVSKMWKEDFYELLAVVDNADFMTRLKYLIRGEF